MGGILMVLGVIEIVGGILLGSMAGRENFATALTIMGPAIFTGILVITIGMIYDKVFELIGRVKKLEEYMIWVTQNMQNQTPQVVQTEQDTSNNT